VAVRAEHAFDVAQLTGLRAPAGPAAARGRAWLRASAALTAAAGFFLAGATSATQPVEVVLGGCDEGVSVRLQEARLSQLLARLAATLGFQLRYWTDDDPVVSYAGTLPAVKLMSSLASQGRIMFSASPDPHCPGQQRLDAVWVLPAGDGRPPKLPPVSRVPVLTVPPDHATQEYLEAHGLAPAPRPGAEAKAAPR
jgi:hypothetical protein